jgi:anti-sigma B factor antagonist
MTPFEEENLMRFGVTRRPLSDGGVELAVSGELDLATAEGFEPLLMETIESTERTVTVDFANCNFVDSAGVRALITAARELEKSGRTLRITGAHAQVRDLFQMIVLNRAPAIDFVDEGDQPAP